MTAINKPARPCRHKARSPGFGYGDVPMLGMAHNLADAAFHVLVALVALFFGFGRRIERLGGPGSRHPA